MSILTVLLTFSSISFIFFGISCFVTPFMKTEFVRYGLANQQSLIGVLQVIGALGLGIGYLYVPLIAIFSAIGLAVLMLLGFGIRLKINDSIIQSAPSLLYALVNGYIAIVLITTTY